MAKRWSIAQWEQKHFVFARSKTLRRPRVVMSALGETRSLSGKKGNVRYQ